MVKVEMFRRSPTSEEESSDYSNFVIQLLGCGLTPPCVGQTQWPFLVLEFAEVRNFIYDFSLLKNRSEPISKLKSKLSPNWG